MTLEDFKKAVGRTEEDGRKIKEIGDNVASNVSRIQYDGASYFGIMVRGDVDSPHAARYIRVLKKLASEISADLSKMEKYM